jgi:hypothetical protein
VPVPDHPLREEIDGTQIRNGSVKNGMHLMRGDEMLLKSPFTKWHKISKRFVQKRI